MPNFRGRIDRGYLGFPLSAVVIPANIFRSAADNRVRLVDLGLGARSGFFLFCGLFAMNHRAVTKVTGCAVWHPAERSRSTAGGNLLGPGPPGRGVGLNRDSLSPRPRYCGRALWRGCGFANVHTALLASGKCERPPELERPLRIRRLAILRGPDELAPGGRARKGIPGIK